MDETLWPVGPPRPKGTAPRVALVNMPFTSARSPSIQLGLLTAVLRRHGVPATSLYFNLDLAASLGWDLYEVLCNDRTLLLGEWLFSRAAFRADAHDASGYVEALRGDLGEHLRAMDRDVNFLLDLRERVLPGFVEECVRRVDWSAFDVVGFSSIFEQNCAALALARRLKEEFPSLVTVFGGANFEDEMGLEYVRALPWIDYAVIGEGDEALPALVRALADDGDPTTVPGVATRAPDGAVRFAGRAPQVTNLDVLPEPDYDTYFTTAQQLGLPAGTNGHRVSLPFETARGCWWGAKHHCTFCGLNGLGMAFRSKSPERALRGIDELAERYAVYQLVAVDNIVDLHYIEGVFDRLAELRRDYTFFYETKANLSHEQIRRLARGGVRHLQPGIESLSTHVLQLMRKGTTAVQNVRALKWGRYHGVSMHWNILVGFPGERPEDYEQQLATARLVPHLQPPESLGRIWLERFSPNFTQRAELGIVNVRPEQAYAFVYPDAVELDRIAYFFSYDAVETVPAAAHEELASYLEDWQQRWASDQPPYLVYQRGAGRLTVTDGRGSGPAQVLSFDELAAAVYECCTPAEHSASRIVDLVGEASDVEADRGAVQAALDEFTALGLMLRENDRYLSLALPINPNW
ncbi:ribosomal peptide maturation radical SAM protein 1 [Kitasatospora sp. MAA19]|uniref:RiPP maturation radical SAM C-methyltransferase n=1 Tax=unclassified Kitasatospora TaxID=2633591 RepID=UPI0024745B3B|nr:RiPP maturation radical SAM C-methyltransferase [Kitasatospora sp. MAA19]MDH6709133.1 ribosomal peptide maturation radical SAM protein 1 [Kitasatospora sp. MAA19]